MRTMFKYNSTTILRESPKENNNIGLTHDTEGPVIGARSASCRSPVAAVARRLRHPNRSQGTNRQNL